MPSKLLLGLIGCVSIVSSLILCFLPIAFLIKLIAIVIVLASSLYFILRDVMLVLPWSWQLVEVDSKGQLKVINQLGETFTPALHASSFVHAKLMIINFKSAPFKWTLPPALLMKHPQYADEIRRLRVWLLWYKSDKNIYYALSDDTLDF